MKLTWEKQTRPYQVGENFRVGRVVVGSAFHKFNNRENEPQEYGSRIELPGIKVKVKTHMTMQDAKARVESAVVIWMRWIGVLPDK